MAALCAASWRCATLVPRSQLHTSSFSSHARFGRPASRTAFTRAPAPLAFAPSSPLRPSSCLHRRIFSASSSALSPVHAWAPVVKHRRLLHSGTTLTRSSDAHAASNLTKTHSHSHSNSNSNSKSPARLHLPTDTASSASSSAPQHPVIPLDWSPVAGSRSSPVRLDGRLMADRILSDLHAVSRTLPRPPGLVVVTVAPTKDSEIYARKKQEACSKSGIDCVIDKHSGQITQQQLLDRIREHCADERVHGVIIQLPLPPHIDPLLSLAAVTPMKDVDGLNPSSMGLLLSGRPSFLPAAPAAILYILMHLGIIKRSPWQHLLVHPLSFGATASAAPPHSTPAEPVPKHNKTYHVAIVGDGHLVAKPVGALLMNADPVTVTVSSPASPYHQLTRTADVVIAACNSPRRIKPDEVKEGAIVIDVGVHASRSERGLRVIGDVDPSTYSRSSAYTPVPGGLGPLTVAMLLRNIMQAATTHPHLVLPDGTPIFGARQRPGDAKYTH